MGSAGAIELLDALENIRPHVVWIFTTTKDGQDRLFDDQIDTHPLLSRCLEFGLAERDLSAAFAARAQQVATAEGLNGQPWSNTSSWSRASATIRSACSRRLSRGNASRLTPARRTPAGNRSTRSAGLATSAGSTFSREGYDNGSRD